MSPLVTPSSLGEVDVKVTERGVPRDRYDRPLIRVEGEEKLVPYTRVTTFVDAIEDKSSLVDWHGRMVALGAAMRPTMLNGLLDLNLDSPSDKRILNSQARAMADLAGAHAKAETGTRLHFLSEFVDRDEELPPHTPDEAADMAAYREARSGLLTPLHVERLVVCDELRVAGTPDRVEHYDGPGPGAYIEGAPEWLTGNIITDLKTGSVQYGALKMAAQLAVYAHGEFYDHETETRTPLPDVNQEWGLILNLPPGSGKGILHWVDLSLGWEVAQTCLTVRNLRKLAKRALTPIV